jgi:hypothetical protein
MATAKKAVAPWMVPEDAMDMPMGGAGMMGDMMPMPSKPVIGKAKSKPKAKAKTKPKAKKKAAKKGKK